MQPFPRLSDSKGAFQVICIYYWKSSFFSTLVHIHALFSVFFFVLTLMMGSKLFPPHHHLLRTPRLDIIYFSSLWEASFTNPCWWQIKNNNWKWLDKVEKDRMKKTEWKRNNQTSFIHSTTLIDICLTYITGYGSYLESVTGRKKKGNKFFKNLRQGR